MRRFEHSGGARPYIGINRDGLSVETYTGRRRDGLVQDRVRYFSSEPAAVAHADALIAATLAQGYVEYDAGAADPSAEPGLRRADEDAWALPARWVNSVAVRRGGVRWPALPANASSVSTTRRMVAAQSGPLGRMLANPHSDRAVAAAGTAWLEAGPEAAPADGSSLGAAVVAGGVAYTLSWKASGYIGHFADAWVATGGVVFAARAMADLGGLFFSPQRDADDPLHVRYLAATEPGPNRGAYTPQFVLAARVRAHLAAASDEDYRRACAALAAYRGGGLHQRAVVSFLVPTQTAWVDADCAAHAASPDDRVVDELLACAASSVEHLRAVSAEAVLSHRRTILDGLGTAVTPVFVALFDGHWRTVEVLTALPTDEAFQALLTHVQDPHIAPVVLENTLRYPVRALRLLSAEAGGRSARADIAAELLRVHVVGNPDVVGPALPHLEPATRRRVEAILAAGAVDPAPDAALPEVLVAPQWTVDRDRYRPTVIPGLVSAPADTVVVWAPGEREEWAASFDDERPWWRQQDWQEEADRQRQGTLESYRQPAFFAAAPEHLARPLLPAWRPSTTWLAGKWTRCVAGRFGLDALPVVWEMATRSPVTAAGALLPYGTAEIAHQMADWLVRTRSLRPVAAAWLARHAALAAATLIPPALGKPGKVRRAAEAALRALVAAGHREQVVDAAREYGPQAAKAVDALLDTDPLDVLPARIPALPEWIDPALPPPVRLRDAAGVLGPDPVRHLCTMLAMSRIDDPYAGIAAVKRACDPACLADLAWALFVRWLAVDAPAEDGWVLDALGLLGDDRTARRLVPLITAWPGQHENRRALAGLDVLAAIGTDVALMHLHSIAQRVRFKSLREHAAARIADLAADRGLHPEQLADRLVPDLGLDSAGRLTLDYGPRCFTVGFDERLAPYVTDETGRRRPDLPKPAARDDPARAAAARKTFTALKKDVRAIAADQMYRLEQAMVSQRRWTAAEFRDLFVAHPLLCHLVRRLVWATFDGDGVARTALRVAEDRTLADVDDNRTTLAEDAVVGIAHPLHLGAALTAWSQMFADYEIVQPFPQLGRDTYTLTPAERDATSLLRFRGATVPTGKVLGLERRGWHQGPRQQSGDLQWMQRPTVGNRLLVVALDPGIPVGYTDEISEQTLDDVWVNDGPRVGWDRTGALPLGVLDPITASEFVRDLTALTSTKL